MDGGSLEERKSVPHSEGGRTFGGLGEEKVSGGKSATSAWCFYCPHIKKTTG